jgi:hypothetical protein
MKRSLLALACVGLIALGVIVCQAQPAGGPPEGGQGGPGGQNSKGGKAGKAGKSGQNGHQRSQHPMVGPILKVLDTNGDGELSAEEIANAPRSLLKLDKNGDGKLDKDDLRPPPPPDGQHGQGGGQGGPSGPPQGGPNAQEGGQHDNAQPNPERPSRGGSGKGGKRPPHAN